MNLQISTKHGERLLQNIFQVLTPLLVSRMKALMHLHLAQRCCTVQWRNSQTNLMSFRVKYSSQYFPSDLFCSLTANCNDHCFTRHRSSKRTKPPASTKIIEKKISSVLQNLHSFGFWQFST